MKDKQKQAKEPIVKILINKDSLIDRLYGVARTVQFQDGIDCFYDNSKIDQFINACYNRLYGN